LFHEFFRWLQEDLGRRASDGMSWSQQWHGSYNLWNVMEGTHVLTIMFFAGTIWIIDLRMMGLAFKNIPFSRLNDRVLPITIAAFAMMIITGIITFFGRDPLLYYHNVWFRFKMLFLVLAMANIVWFHFKVQKNQGEWDALEKPPAKVRLSGAFSMASWFLIIVLGRFIAYDWFYCEKTQPGTFIYAIQECKSALHYLPVEGEEAPAEEVVEPGDPPPDGADAADTTPDQTTVDPGAAPPPPSTEPAQPAPGNGG
jgi:hypothetical protein